MLKNKGFIIVETIVTVVILSTSLLYLYSSYSSIINREETRLYYDDLAYLYRTNQIRNFLENNVDMDNIKRNGFENTYIINIGNNYENMFTPEQISAGWQDSYSHIFSVFNINNIVLMDTRMLDDCDTEYSDAATEEKCNNSNEVLGTYDMRSYVRSLNDTTYDFYLVVEYLENLENGIPTKCVPGIDANCMSHYASLGI